MISILIIAMLMVISELILAFLFSLIAQQYYKKSEIDMKSISRGFIERLFLTIFMFNGIPHALTFFSALKLATRLKHDDKNGETEKFNNYYLIGNMVSVTVSLFYVCIWNHAGDIENGINRFLNK
jgi:zinc transporter ZupT